jgi:uncharacterized membrane protein YccC
VSRDALAAPAHRAAGWGTAALGLSIPISTAADNILLLAAIAYGVSVPATPLERDLARGLVIAIAVGGVFNSLLLDHTEGLLFAWLTAVLYAGYNRPHSPAEAHA